MRATCADRVVGELMFIRPGLHAEVLATLDRLEGCHPGGRSHYDRVVAMACYQLGGKRRAVEAWVYVAGAWFQPSA